MKLAFSTLGCPNYTWPEIYTMAKDLGFDGIEIRGLGETIHAIHAHPFLDLQIDKTVEKLKQLGLEIPCLSSSCCLKYKDKEAENIAEISGYINLAKKLGTPYIRILADREPAPEGEVDDGYIANVLSRLAKQAEENSVILLVETNGVYADTSRLAALLSAVNSEHVCALWDIHHPYRFFNETPRQSVQNLGDKIKYVHVKDSSPENGKIVYKLLGEGDMPLSQVFTSLENGINYDGYLSLEWVKRWMPSLVDGGIVFPHYVNHMERYIRKSPEPVQYSNDKKGTYIWEKEKLIDYTFPEILDKMCDVYPNQCAFTFTELDYTRTYSEFRDDVETFARALISMDVKRGDHVAVWSTNRPEWYITFWAVTKIGAVLVTVNTSYKIHEAEYLLRQSDTHTLVLIDGYKDSDYIGTV
ncbi:MAG: TIM barrel protein, partial [Leptospirales bacterium]|nr:TIM barrel protein [Leptospirales bacterium]